MFENGKFVKIESIYVNNDKPDIAYCVLNSPEFMKWGECKVRMEGLSPDVLQLMYEMGSDFPYLLTADVTLGIWGSGRDATNTVTLTNVHWDDPLGSMNMTRSMKQMAQKVMAEMSGQVPNGKKPAPAPEKEAK